MRLVSALAASRTIVFAALTTTGLLFAVPHPAAQAPRASAADDEAVTTLKTGTAQVTVDVKPIAVLEGHDVRATVKVNPESSNRLLSVAIDAPTFYASTERELMGAAAPRTYTFKWDKLPAGQYTVEAIVTDAAGRLTRVQREFLVHGLVSDGEMQPTTPNPGRRGRRGRQ